MTGGGLSLPSWMSEGLIQEWYLSKKGEGRSGGGDAWRTQARCGARVLMYELSRAVVTN